MTANGRLKLSQLTRVQDGSKGPIYLENRAAAQLAKLAAACKRDTGEEMTLYDPAGGYRSIATQEAMEADPGSWNVDPDVVLADVGASSHGEGEAADIDDGFGYALEHAAYYGWHRPNPTGDPHHFLYDGITTAGVGPVTVLKPKEIDMKLLQKTSTGTLYLLGEISCNAVPPQKKNTVLETYGTPHQVSDPELASLTGIAKATRSALIKDIVAALPKK